MTEAFLSPFNTWEKWVCEFVAKDFGQCGARHFGKKETWAKQSVHSM